MKSWFSLKTGEPASRSRYRSPFVISIPKKIERLAVRRNRLKRLFREAARGIAYFETGSKLYYFHVRAMPRELTLAAVRKAVEKAIET